MKFLLTIVALCFALVSCSEQADLANQSSSNTNSSLVADEKVNNLGAKGVEAELPKTTVEFENSTLDLGFLKQGEKGSGTFEFTNTGTEPLIISSAKGSCGCTVPKWPKEPIAPGETATIDIEFNSKGKKGKQTKTVTIQANTDPNPMRLTVKADIEAPAVDETAAK